MRVRINAIKLFSFFILFIAYEPSCIGQDVNLNFNNRSSTITVKDGCNFIVSTAIDSWDGTLKREESGLIDGENIYFVGGVLESANAEVLMTATYDPTTGSDDIILGGSSGTLNRFRSEPGTLVHQLKVYGSNNRLEGQPLFSNPILFDTGATLTVALQNKLNKDLYLNSGTLRLDDDLGLADDVKLLTSVGSNVGSVYLNGKQFSFAGYYSSPWENKIFWYGATDIALNCKTELDGEWYFNGISTLNGNGNILQLNENSKIIIDSNSTLILNDISLQNLRNLQLIFTDNTSTVSLSNVAIELITDITTTVGNVYTNGPTTFILKDKDWNFTTNSRLTVDGVTLWLDTLGHIEWPEPGQLSAPLPLYIGHIWSEDNHNYNIGPNGNLSLLESATVKEVCDRSLAWSSISSLLVTNNLTQNITLDQSVHLHPDHQINICSDLTINGSGALLVFSNPVDTPQFIVNEGITVKLENLELMHINARTFSLCKDSKVEIGENVLFELSENVTFTCGRFEILGSTSDTNIFTIRGLGGVKQLGFEGEYLFRPAGIDLGVNTLLLQDIELLSVSNVSRTPNSSVLGSVGLGGGAIVNVDVGTNIGFVVEGLNNEIKITENDLLLEGALLFGDYTENLLNFDFAIPSRYRSPSVRFKDNFLRLNSESGRSTLIFRDNEITVYNLGTNSFVLGDHAFLDGESVEILTYPIKQTSNDVDFGLGLVLSSDQSNVVVFGDTFSFRAPFEISTFNSGEVTTALHLKREREYAQLQQLKFEHQIAAQLAELQKAEKESTPIVIKPVDEKDKKQTGQRPLIRPSSRPGSKITRSPAWLEEENLALTRAPSMSSQEHMVYRNVVSLGEASGNIILKSAKINDFGIDSSVALNLTMSNGSEIKQGSSAVTVKSGDILNVLGKDNKIIVRGSWYILGKLLFEANSELTFEFDEKVKNPSITLSLAEVLDLEPEARLEFKGKGTVYLANGTEINFKGTTSSNRPEFILNDLTIVELAGASAQVKGYGDFIVDNGAKIKVEESEHLIFGATSTDNLGLKFDRLGSLNISGEDAKVSLKDATFSVTFDHAATLFVGSNAEFEINLLNGTISSGNVTGFIFDNDARLKIGESGLLSLAQNDSDATIFWDHKEGRIVTVGDGGIVRLIESPAKTTMFAGRIPSTSIVDKNTFNMGQSLTALQVVQAFLQRQPDSLTYSTVFYDSSDNRILRTKDGDSQTLDTNDLVEEDASGNSIVNGYYI